MTISRATIVLFALLLGFGVFAGRGQEPAAVASAARSPQRDIEALEIAVDELYGRLLEMEKFLRMVRANPKDLARMNIIRSNENKRLFDKTKQDRVDRRRRIAHQEKVRRLMRMFDEKPLDVRAWAKLHMDIDAEAIADLHAWMEEHRTIADSNFSALDRRVAAIEIRQ